MHIVQHLVMAYGKLMMEATIGIILEKVLLPVLMLCLSQLVHPIVGTGCIDYMPEQSPALFMFQTTKVNLGKRWKP